MIRPSSLFLLFPLLLVGCGDDDAPAAPAVPAGQGGAGSGGVAGAGASGSAGGGQGGSGGLSGSSGQGGAGASQAGGGQAGGGQAGSAGSGGGGPLPSCPEGVACVLIEPGQMKHTIPSALFGDNTEWPENANGLWDEKAKAPTKNVVELLKPLGMTLLRFPGGTPSDFYHWAEAVGPARKPQINPFQLDEQGQLSKQMPNFGPDEVASLAEQIGAKVFVTANVGTGTAQEAADWLKYYQGKGVDAPYWEVGNEVWITGDGIDAVTQRKTPEEYVTIFNEYAKALRAVDPGVQVGAIGCSNWLSTTLCQDPEWNQKVLGGITEKIDFFAVHNAYPLIVENYSEERDEALARSVLGSIQHIRASFDEVEGQLTKLAKGDNAKAPVALTEFSSYYVPDIANDPKWIEALYRNRTVAAALFSASVFQLLFRDERVSIATHLPLISAGFQSALATNAVNQNPVLSVYGQVLKLYAEASGAQLVGSSVAGSPTFSGEQTPFMPASKDVPTLDAVAVRKGSETWVYVINRDLQAAQTVTLALAQEQEVTEVSLTQLQGDSFRAKNTPESPDAVKVVTSPLTASRQLELSLPPHSLSRVVFK